MADISPAYDAKALEVPATFVNHIQVARLGTSLIRLTFGETPVPKVVAHRSAVVMAIEDARALMNVLQQALGANLMPQSAGSRPN